MVVEHGLQTICGLRRSPTACWSSSRLWLLNATTGMNTCPAWEVLKHHLKHPCNHGPEVSVTSDPLSGPEGKSRLPTALPI